MKVKIKIKKKALKEGGRKGKKKPSVSKMRVYRSGLRHFRSSHVTPKLKFKETFEA